MGFAEFKKAQAKQDEAKFIEESEETRSFKDDRFWMPTKDGSGNSKSIIRFLPQTDPTKSPYVKTFKHAFQNPKTKRWFVEECPWTLKIPCPVCAYAQEEYNKGNRKPNKQTWYIVNILVVKDENAPENEGKVFLYKFGREIFKKIENAVKGDPDDDLDPISVFNIMNGHNFRLTITSKTIPEFDRPVNDYDKCRFEIEGNTICDGDEEQMEKVYNCIYDLDEFLDPKLFKSKEELKKKLASFLGGGSSKSVLDELREQQANEKAEEKPTKEDESPFDDDDNIPDFDKKDDSDDDDFFASLDDDDDDIPFD